MTEGRERFPVQVRYNRASREDEEEVKNLLLSAASAPRAAAPAALPKPARVA